MNDSETIFKKRIKVIKECTLILMVYAVFILVLFALQATGTIDIFNPASMKGMTSTIEMAVMGSCIVGIAIGALCFFKVKAPEWYGRLTLLFFCDVIINIVIIIYLFANNVDNRMAIIVFIQIPFACVAALALNRLKANLQKGK